MKLNCYECEYRGNVPGDAHSCCHYPGNKVDSIFDFFLQTSDNAKKLNIKADAHGIDNGWFLWPVNFDPVWLESCDGFKQKESK